MAEKKNTIYLDIDEDITELVGKIQSSKQDIIALVLPKRAAVMQSIVNVRLLSRAAQQNDKNIVLITSDPTIVSHAGAVGLYVADNLTSKPYLPENSGQDESAEDEPEEELEIESEPAMQTAPASKPAKPAPAKSKGARKSKIKVPDFSKFRTWLIIGGILLACLIFFGVWNFFFSGSASVKLKTDTTDKVANVDVKLDTSATEVDVDAKILPARQEEMKKNESEKVPATGTKDKGAKAGGTITLKNCGSQNATIPAGTGVSSGSSTYITQQSISLSDGNFDGGGNCKSNGSHVGTVNVLAQSNGEQYNSGPRSYTVAGFSQITAQGDSMTGGSSQVVKVVAQSDVDAAKSKISERHKSDLDELKKKLQKDSYLVIEQTYSYKESNPVISPAVGAEANEVTVSMAVTSTVMGVKEDDLKKIIDKEYEEELKTAQFNIVNYGLDQARYTPDKDNKNVNVQTTISIGPDIDEQDIKDTIKGKKSGEAEQLLQTKKGVVEAQVKLSPFWKTKVPKKDNKITITVEKK